MSTRKRLDYELISDIYIIGTDSITTNLFFIRKVFFLAKSTKLQILKVPTFCIVTTEKNSLLYWAHFLAFGEIVKTYVKSRTSHKC